MKKEQYLYATKGYASDENLVFMKNDLVKVNDVEEGMIYIEGVKGWCEGIEMNFIPKIIAEYFEAAYMR
jgi:hypothetical protein